MKQGTKKHIEKSLLDCDWVVKNFSKDEANKLKTIMIAVHGFSSSRNSFVFAKISPTLKENNIGLVCFDLPGHGLRKNEKLNVKACLDTIKSIEDAAYNYSVKNDIGYQLYYKKITLEELSTAGLLEKEIIDPVTNNKMNGCVLYKWDEVYKQYEFKYDEECYIPLPESISFAEDSNVLMKDFHKQHVDLWLSL